VRGVTVSDLVIDGSGTVSNGIALNGVVDSTISNVTAQNFVDWGLLSYWSYDLVLNNVAVQHAGNANSDAFQLWGAGRAKINGLAISHLNRNAFGFGLSTVADSVFTNVTVDASSTTSARPAKLLAASYNTFHHLTVTNGGGDYNGVSLEYYSSHNIFDQCVVTNNSGTGILGFGNYNSYNKFVNCNVARNSGWQLGQGKSALGAHGDANWEISGGTYSGAGTNSVFQLNGNNNYVHNATVNGPGDNGIYVGGTNNCINSNSFGGSFKYYAINFSGGGNRGNDNSGAHSTHPMWLPSGHCPAGS
jgi:hypothetical protein